MPFDILRQSHRFRIWCQFFKRQSFWSFFFGKPLKSFCGFQSSREMWFMYYVDEITYKRINQTTTSTANSSWTTDCKVFMTTMRLMINYITWYIQWVSRTKHSNTHTDMWSKFGLQNFDLKSRMSMKIYKKMWNFSTIFREILAFAPTIQSCPPQKSEEETSTARNTVSVYS